MKHNPVDIIPVSSSHGQGCTPTATPLTAAHFHASICLPTPHSFTFHKQMRVKGDPFIPSIDPASFTPTPHTFLIVTPSTLGNALGLNLSSGWSPTSPAILTPLPTLLMYTSEMVTMFSTPPDASLPMAMALKGEEPVILLIVMAVLGRP
ncbi:hypothetical protein IEQ34_004728 [Dendrobium chrysotoxum]|uniref:Uncharacterized protein n=1 Tax=Dendrobium chrysotoxum TaxID=161865 RepID=A0AAV7H096_DENCH|nr:hypothetical protein IEQ34_004728 [Dendrobium chrysotoxum]